MTWHLHECQFLRYRRHLLKHLVFVVAEFFTVFCWRRVLLYYEHVTIYFYVTALWYLLTEHKWKHKTAACHKIFRAFTAFFHAPIKASVALAANAEFVSWALFTFPCAVRWFSAIYFRHTNVCVIDFRVQTASICTMVICIKCKFNEHYNAQRQVRFIVLSLLAGCVGHAILATKL